MTDAQSAILRLDQEQVRRATATKVECPRCGDWYWTDEGHRCPCAR